MRFQIFFKIEGFRFDFECTIEFDMPGYKFRTVFAFTAIVILQTLFEIGRITDVCLIGVINAS